LQWWRSLMVCLSHHGNKRASDCWLPPVMRKLDRLQPIDFS
jgi:hypothetical protein